MTPPSTTAQEQAAVAVDSLAQQPQVKEAVDRARDACTSLRWHEALRRRMAAAAAESRVRGARASALLDGADQPLDAIRDIMRGAVPWEEGADPVGRTVQAAVAATAEAEHVRGLLRRSPMQGLARLHVAAGAPLLPAEQVGRPRVDAEMAAELVEAGEAPPANQVRGRLVAVTNLLALGSDAPALVVAALVHAEIASARPFVGGNGLVARAAERAVLQESGLDPTAVAVPEVGHHARGSSGYVRALQAYASGERDGVVYWLRHCAGALEAGAAEGVRIADAVLAGRLGVVE